MKTYKLAAKSFTHMASLALLFIPAACAPTDADQDEMDGEYSDEGSYEDKALLSTIQAEAHTAQSGCADAKNHDGFSGTGFVDYGDGGSWAEWNNVYVSTAGQYILTFRYAIGGADARPSDLRVNGANAGTIAFKATGGWSNWSTVSVTTYLRAGNNTVRVTAGSNAGPNLDRLEVASGSVPPPPPPPPPSGGISHVGTKSVYDYDGQGLTIARPSGVQDGDLLVLALHRTDDFLPLKVDGWTRVAECYKRDNGFQCSTANDCTSWSGNGKFCNYFGDYGREGRDLAQSIFYKVASSEPSSYRFDLNQDTSGHPSWAILTALRGAATSSPVRAWANRGCDNSSASVFPSVRGEPGDMLLLSQSFDDNVKEPAFTAPSGTSLFGFINGDSGPAPDETGYMFGKILTASGNTGELRTGGVGGSGCKDALVSLTIKPR